MERVVRLPAVYPLRLSRSDSNTLESEQACCKTRNGCSVTVTTATSKDDMSKVPSRISVVMRLQMADVLLALPGYRSIVLSMALLPRECIHETTVW